MIFSENTYSSLKKSLDKGAPVAGPSDIQILPTPRCNAACSFCPLNAIPGELMKHTPRFSTYRKDLPGGLLDRLADDLHHLGGLERVTITGGEPLLYTHIIAAVFQFTRSFPNAEVTLVTNGIKLADFSVFLATAGLANVYVSINAGKEESFMKQNPTAATGTFGRIVEGVDALSKASKKTGAPQIGLSAVLTKHSVSDVADLFELGRRLGVSSVTYLPLMEIRLEGEAVNRGLSAAPDEFASFMDEVEKYGELAAQEGFFLGYAGTREDGGIIAAGDAYKNQPCYAGFSFAAIYPNGDVRPCCHCEPIMGNLRRNSFGEIWTSERYQEQRKKMLGINSGEALPGCLCDECGYVFENRDLHQGITG